MLLLSLLYNPIQYHSVMQKRLSIITKHDETSTACGLTFAQNFDIRKNHQLIFCQKSEVSIKAKEFSPIHVAENDSHPLESDYAAYYTQLQGDWRWRLSYLENLQEGYLNSGHLQI